MNLSQQSLTTCTALPPAPPCPAWSRRRPWPLPLAIGGWSSRCTARPSAAPQVGLQTAGQAAGGDERRQTSGAWRRRRLERSGAVAGTLLIVCSSSSTGRGARGGAGAAGRHTSTQRCSQGARLMEGSAPAGCDRDAGALGGVPKLPGGLQARSEGRAGLCEVLEAVGCRRSSDGRRVCRRCLQRLGTRSPSWACFATSVAPRLLMLQPA